MSFTASNLSVLAYANNFTLWHYTSTDSAATIAISMGAPISQNRATTAEAAFRIPNDRWLRVKSTGTGSSDRFLAASRSTSVPVIRSP